MPASSSTESPLKKMKKWFIGDEILPSYVGIVINKPLGIRIPIKQTGFNGKYPSFSPTARMAAMGLNRPGQWDVVNVSWGRMPWPLARSHRGSRFSA